MTENQNPEQQARDRIDAQLRAAGWVVQAKSKVNFGAVSGVAVREWQTEGCAAAKLKWVSNKASLPFLYEATGAISLEEQLEIVQELESKLSEADQLDQSLATALLECLRTAKSHGMKTSGKRGKSG